MPKLAGISNRESAVEEAHGESPATIRDHIVRQVRKWMLTQEDDVTLLVARYSSEK